MPPISLRSRRFQRGRQINKRGDDSVAEEIELFHID
ncbi:hypothetical protein CLOLEP_02545 [[Clostridium] leptum DSM 753]|uniref:Uncharacterized protein n=1 Tax=[Clostridium] leptum DSM 753 TaxID=428125 RepID=A7VVD3_9FIRM|nr:hypothetical protein CLOLEP_02545 [[Clostridium] leptum DSM 753]